MLFTRVHLEYASLRRYVDGLSVALSMGEGLPFDTARVVLSLAEGLAAAC
jgi:hypothetical protein